MPPATLIGGPADRRLSAIIRLLFWRLRLALEVASHRLSGRTFSLCSYSAFRASLPILLNRPRRNMGFHDSSGIHVFAK
jgi:hypothetical protein